MIAWRCIIRGPGGIYLSTTSPSSSRCFLDPNGQFFLSITRIARPAEERLSQWIRFSRHMREEGLLRTEVFYSRELTDVAYTTKIRVVRIDVMYSRRILLVRTFLIK